MEKIVFDNTTHVWKRKLNLLNSKKSFLNLAYNIIDNTKGNLDAYGYKKIWDTNDASNYFKINNELDSVILNSIEESKLIYLQTNSTFNVVNFETWINVVRSKTPIQTQFKDGIIKKNDKFHSHTEINKQYDNFIPTYTFVYYIQMPNRLNNEDGVLYLKGENDIEYSILPEEDDLIIMPGDLYHGPNNAPHSTIDRIVLAGNIEIRYDKQIKSLL